MKNVVIVDSVRTGLSKSFRGSFNMTRGDDMLSHLIDALLERNPNLPPDTVEDVIMGCGNPGQQLDIILEEMQLYYQSYQLQLVVQL